MNGDDGVPAVVLAGEQRLGFDAIDLRAQGVELRAQLARDVLALLRQLKVRFEVGDFPTQASVEFDRPLKAFALRQNFLGIGLVLPEVRIG